LGFHQAHDQKALSENIMIPDGLSAADVLQGLTELAENGEVRVRTPNRWILARYLQSSSARSSSAPSGGEADAVDETLRAAYGTVVRAEPTPMSLEPEGPGAPWRLSELWRELMAYYAATQRADPRGRICQFPDRHGTAWHLVSFAGDWWRNARLDFPLAGLAEGFREALLKRPERSCAIGYPLTIIFCRHIVLISFIKIISSDFYTVMHTVRKRRS
jgi:hypothetical protein